MLIFCSPPKADQTAFPQWGEVIHCCLLNVGAWKSSNLEIHACFSQNIVLCVLELWSDIQLKANSYALLNFCLNSGLSITLFNASIMFEVQSPDYRSLSWCITCSHQSEMIFTHSAQSWWLYTYQKTPAYPHGPTATPNQPRNMRVKWHSPSWQSIQTLLCVNSLHLQQSRAGFVFPAKMFWDRRYPEQPTPSNLLLLITNLASSEWISISASGTSHVANISVRCLSSFSN